ncbi:MAG: CDP-alcohol phosphatidyltransferase family protein [Paludibacteraceae bacterium]|nr:CDP-alcohol phosphatidyltransferase family protein [Paludibacteraceae bacterium]MBQ6766917.1 CDP-alcohol phosphatidyltransferase family protein [Paludibacteraceae bacterium]MDY6373139.1 CDP-alcohol phosphatidyltransferase family protein [Bacteroidales bacterium]MDY6427003.1 CDP-alcohol phosphatidyltransferase family protein [Bacteroidales bacterium]
MKQHIPNMVTCLNLLSGCVATVFALQGDAFTATIFIMAGAVFDFFDGFLARLLDAHSVIGKDMDSLADDITFGLAPAALMFSLFKQYPYVTEFGAIYVPYTAFLIAAFSAIRLAKFNNDARQTKSFIGLPTPANALLIAGIANAPMASFMWMDWPEFATLWRCPGVGLSVLIILTGTLCYLLVSEIPMFSLKERGKLQYAFLAISAILILLCGFLGLAVAMATYITISWIKMIIDTDDV